MWWLFQWTLLSGCWWILSLVSFFSVVFTMIDMEVLTHRSKTYTGTNNCTNHFDLKLACHGHYELQKHNKAVVYSWLIRHPFVMWGNNKRAYFSPQVESPLAVDAVLGESAFSVTDDKVSITELRVHAISGLTLSLQPSPGNSHTMVAKATGLQTLITPKQVEYDLWHCAEKRNY